MTVGDDNDIEFVSDTALRDQVSKLEREVGTVKRLAVASTIAAIVLGSGGIFGVLQWFAKNPALEQKIATAQLNNTEIETKLKRVNTDLAAFELESKRQGVQAEQDAKAVVSLAEKLQLQARVHQEAVQSLTREKDLASGANDNAAVRLLASQLIERERAWRRVLEKLPPQLTQSSTVMASATRDAVRESEIFEVRLEQIVASVSSRKTSAAPQASAPKPRINRSRSPAPVSVTTESIEDLEFDDEPFIGENGHYLRIPPDHHVGLTVEGPSELKLAAFGYLCLEASLVSNINRVSYKDKRILFELGHGERAVFTTPFDRGCDLEFEFGRVDAPDLAEFDKTESGKFKKIASGNGSVTGVVYEGLPKGFKINITWRSLAND